MGSNPFEQPTVTKADAAVSAVRYALTGNNPHARTRDVILAGIVLVCLIVTAAVAVDPFMALIPAALGVIAVLLLVVGR